MKRIKYILPALICLCMMSTLFTSCDDMLDMGNEDMLYADENHLTQGNDTVNSYVGILNQLQKVAVRTNLFGELRGDLVTVSTNAKDEIKAIAEFRVDDDNPYNTPRDFYAVINNCNYFLANADTVLHETTFSGGAMSEFYVFRAEYVAVRAVRAWLYLQLAQIYGDNIPVVTEPILTISEADNQLANAPRMNIEGICDYFASDLEPYVSWFAYPYHGNPQYQYNQKMSSRASVFPVSVVLGDLYLWLASIRHDPLLAEKAAKNYYDYIYWAPTDGVKYKVRNTIGTSVAEWQENELSNSNYSRLSVTRWRTFIDNSISTATFGTESDEVITAIAMDTAAVQTHFNELRYLYSYDPNSSTGNASILPSKVCYDYSDKQVYYGTYPGNSPGTWDYTTVGAGALGEQLVSAHAVGDLRLAGILQWESATDLDYERLNNQKFSNYGNNTNIVIYRTAEVYLRLAEALNYAGYPKFALAILTCGLDNQVMDSQVRNLYTTTHEKTFLDQFQFPTVDDGDGRFRTVFYQSASAEPIHNNFSQNTVNQLGLHARGSGWTVTRPGYKYSNPYYYPPATDTPTDSTGFPSRPISFNKHTTTSTVGADILADVLALNPVLSADAAADPVYTVPYIDLDDGSYTDGKAKREAAEEYEADLKAYADTLYAHFQADSASWYRDKGMPQVRARQIEVVDSLIDIEQALETCFEGHRFGDLVRQAWRADALLSGRLPAKVDGVVCATKESYLAAKLAKRSPAAAAAAANYSNWFISWSNVIGK